MVALARVLGIGLAGLRDVIGRSDRLYRLVERKPKKQGGYREIREALEPLKTIQKRIVVRIVGSVDFPDYLMGGIKDPERKRGYIRSAQLHAGADLLVSEDIADFFPSVSTAQVELIFLHMFHFQPTVAEALGRLCTRCDELPQGASTSTALANLVLFQREPALVEVLEHRGFRYSRFVDDVNVSTTDPHTAMDAVEAVRSVRQMIERSGFRPKRAKQGVYRRGQPKRIHNLNVDERVTIPLAERKNIRAAVYRLERDIASGFPPIEFAKDLDRTTSRAARIRMLHPREGQALLNRLRALRMATNVNRRSM
jgi:hypothetical protein